MVVAVAVGSSRDDVLIEEGNFVFDGGTSLQPNQPGVWQVVVGVGGDVVVVVVGEMGAVDFVEDGLLVVVVVVSLQPHQPGVLHVTVVLLLDILVNVVVVVVSVPLLWKNFHK